MARSDNLGSVIIGWYKDATVFRDLQKPPDNSNRRYKGEEVEYYVKAKEENCLLLPVDERTFEIPRGRGWMGQANTWYADQEDKGTFKSKVVNFIEKHQK